MVTIIMPTGEENITYLPETKIGDRSRCASVDDEIFNRIWSKKSEQEVVCHQGLLIHLTIAEPNAREFHFSQVHACHVLTLAHASHLDNVPSRLDLGLSCTECKHSRVNDQRMEIMDGNRIRVRKMRVLGNWVNFGQS
ncbi:uncharacterized protein LOC127087381 [Lathyrus oleraceus]|uniref:uncharacterized protein LOC127087381 n=1 Tax=Pisum sativum TaxID=3888 RepID=UPI0021D3A8B3|nr:uncharacterized protein LOC127087381 [Pisum sativum]